MNIRTPLCTYCGTAEGTTADHVPPRCLFPTPPPPNLVTVPCCEPCRKDQSLDDEYFKKMVLIRTDVADHPAISEMLESVHRAFRNPRQQGFTSGLLRTMRVLEVRTQAGLYLGQVPGYDVDLARLGRVIQRTTLGLYFHEFRQRLPDHAACVAYAFDGVPHGNSGANPEFVRLIKHALAGKRVQIGEQVFNYWVRDVDRTNHATLWVHLFYDRVGFLAATIPKPSDARETRLG